MLTLFGYERVTYYKEIESFVIKFKLLRKVIKNLQALKKFGAFESFCRFKSFWIKERKIDVF